MVQRLAMVLQQNPKRVVLVEGFTDSTGTTQHNQELSDAGRQPCEMRCWSWALRVRKFPCAVMARPIRSLPMTPPPIAS